MTEVIKAAGVLWVAEGPVGLFLKRSGSGDGSPNPGEEHDYAGFWDLPGGQCEDGEGAEDAATREFEEETGNTLAGDLQYWTRSRGTLPPTVQTSPMSGGSASVTGAMEAPSASAVPVTPQCDYTTFIYPGIKQFTPVLSDEHSGYAWAPINDPPQPLHPGVAVALKRFGADELQVARMIRYNELISPQKYENIWLFDIRISGTGVAYRRKLDEVVYRMPENYLTEEFLARCNGLPVIWEHPPTQALNTKEFAKRVIGTVLLPYIKGDEVWAIAKIYDAPAAKLMEKEQLSTSPAVVFRDPSVNTKMELENGSTLLIEGKPSLLDHIAICEQGVWDKGGDPTGVRTEAIGDSEMTAATVKMDDDASKKDNKEEVVEKKDASAGTPIDHDLKCMLDSLGSKLDSMHKRMDAMEEEVRRDKKRKDDDDDDAKKDKAKKDESEEEEEKEEEKAKETAADKSKKDKAKRKDDDDDDDDDRKDEKGEDHTPMQIADKKKDDDDDDAKKDRKDSRADSSGISAALRAEIDALKARLPKQLTDADQDALVSVQAKADSVYNIFGKRAPRPLDGESLLGYRRRIVGELKAYSPMWKDTNTNAMPDDGFTVAESQIYADAEQAGRNPIDIPTGQLRQVNRKMPGTNLEMTMFYGPNSFVRGMRREPRLITGFGRFDQAQQR